MNSKDYFDVDLTTGGSDNPWTQEDVNDFMAWQDWLAGGGWMLVNRKT